VLFVQVSASCLYVMNLPCILVNFSSTFRPTSLLTSVFVCVCFAVAATSSVIRIVVKFNESERSGNDVCHNRQMLGSDLAKDIRCPDQKLDRLCCLVVRVLGYRSEGPGSISGTTRKKSSGSGTGSTQPREYN
jgi:hypothetical protein